jgi:aminoglycoside 3-N-acetyltransferase
LTYNLKDAEIDVMMTVDAAPVTRSELAAALRAAGIRPGGILMVHTQMSAIGWVVGGADTVVLALLDALGEDGTLLVYTCWEHDAFHIADWPEDRRAAYLREPPVFDPDVSQSWTGVGRIPERVRTWPGARRSAHPLASVAALGRDADWLTREHRLDDGYGASSPFARLVERRGQILLLGAPLETLTILHHAEALANVAEKRHNRFPARIRTADGTADVEIDDIDTSRGTFDYATVLPDGAVDFDVIGQEALVAGIGRTVRVVNATSHLFEADRLVAFAVAWMEQRFGQR